MPAERREAWKYALAGAFVFLQRAVPSGRMMAATINVFDEMCSHIPTGRIMAAVKRSMTLTDEGGEPLYWDGRAVALAFARLLEEGAFKSDLEEARRLLPDRARAACWRCFGTGLERMPNGSVRPGCKHEEWRPEDERAAVESEESRREFAREQTKIMREILENAGRRRPAEAAKPSVPAGHWLTCDQCGRRVNVLYVEEGQRCGELLNRGTHDGELKLCEGTLAAGRPRRVEATRRVA